MRNPKNNRKYNLEFQVVGEENKPLLGASAIQGMQLITVNTQNILVVEGSQSHEGLTLPQVVMQYKDVFEGDGMLEDKQHLHVDENVKPVQRPVRKPAIALKEKYKMELESSKGNYSSGFRTNRVDFIYFSGIETQWQVARVSRSKAP